VDEASLELDPLDRVGKKSETEETLDRSTCDLAEPITHNGIAYSQRSSSVLRAARHLELELENARIRPRHEQHELNEFARIQRASEAESPIAEGSQCLQGPALERKLHRPCRGQSTRPARGAAE
jgi:hypothetical protein